MLGDDIAMSKPDQITPPDATPTALSRRALRGPVRGSLTLPLTTITPTYGGGSKPGQNDAIDAIRVPSIRGHLRMWWRACVAHEVGDAAGLAAREAALFGAAAGGGRRSAVEVRVDGVRDVDPRIEPRSLGPGGQYVLWVAGQNSHPLTAPGVGFTLTVHAPNDALAELRAALRAWICFGGYGGRTRRGAGSLTITDEAARRDWLPSGLDRAAVLGVLGDVEAEVEAIETPQLAGARLGLGSATTSAASAFESAAKWLYDFRQGGGGRRGERDARYPREPGDGPRDRRLGRSRWPEADKVRQIARGRFDHKPLHDAEPAWPRAGLGLPIVGQFQRNARGGGRLREPDDFEIRWRDPGGEVRDRLASPLIVKPLALADGRYAPMALWLNRAYPEGDVVLRGDRRHNDASAAPFDRLLGAGDEARFTPLDAGRAAPAGQRLATAFFTWLTDTRRAKEAQ